MKMVEEQWKKDIIGGSKRKKSSKCIMNYYHEEFGDVGGEDLFNYGLCSRSGTAMTEEDIDRIISMAIGCGKNK